MNTAKQSIWLFLTLAILAASGWYYVNLETASRLDSETLSSTIDTTISQLTVRQFNSDGLLTNLLTTPLMQHIPKEDIHLLKSPHIIIVQKDQPSWEIRSMKAKSFNGGERINFIKHVVVHQNPGNKTQESTLRTEEVAYFPKLKKATTDLFVTFEQPGNIVESTGMNAYLDEKRVELLHQARGTYAPNKG
ncbi:LPS export ABC transporter periplasmic protein LptC [Legionella antarctica]|uniref:LPS export ABC transporter periplasmic protein LptC n=1 Tax=Legionella antarctica TaxID=2708020 RepID=A0A6F8T4V9_9GAMM|nr:LPS export ABC transporter periplasmic protein LptC [Legionella antarctica]BCA95062.1 LPS export ABC transporter periplasmic protein LptC [Legionella antarctica]